MSHKRIMLFAAAFALAAGAAHAADPAATTPAAAQPAAATDQSASTTTIQNPASVTIQQDAASAVTVTTPTASAAPLTLQERDEFVQESSVTIQNAKQVAERVEAGLKDGSLQNYKREDLENLKNRISEAEAMSNKFARGTVDTLQKDYKSAQKAMYELADAYYPAASMFDDARKKEETQVQMQIAQLEQHKSTLQATAGATKLSSALKGTVKATEDKLEASIKASQKRLGKLQSAKAGQWVSLRQDAQQTFDKTDDNYHQTIERITRPS